MTSHDNVTDIEKRAKAALDQKMSMTVGEAGSWINLYGIALIDEAATLRKQLENAREALEQIADPIGHAQKIAKDGGMSIDGHMAVRLANDAEYLKGIATRGLRGLS